MRTALIERNSEKKKNEIQSNKRNTFLLLIVSLLLFLGITGVSIFFFVETTKNQLYSSYEREVGNNVSNILIQQSITNMLIEDLALSLIEIGENQTSSMLTFADANFTEIISCGVRYGSSCSIPSRDASQNYTDFETFRNGTIRYSELNSMNAHFVISEIANFSAPLVFESGSICDLVISMDTGCYLNRPPPISGTSTLTWPSAYRPNPIVFNCTGYSGCVNPKTVLLTRVVTTVLSRYNFVFGNVITNPPPLLSVDIQDIKMLIEGTFI